MAVRKVVVLGNPVLRKKAEPVPPEKIQSPEIQRLVKDMFETMVEYDGRGLAAPQILERLQIVVMLWDFTPDTPSKVVCLINPKLETLSQETESYWEGCLSLPGLRGKVARPRKIKVQALDEKGEPVEFIAEGFAATVVQHECDHLDGKLFIDRMNNFESLAYDREYQKYFARQ